MKPRALPGGLLLAVLSGALAYFIPCLGPGSRAHAEVDAATAVLGLEALDGAPDNVATEITDALRQRVASTHGFQLVQGKDLVEVKLVFSCPDEGTACMAQAAKSMGATKLIYGNVKRSGADYQVSLKLLDVNRAAVDQWVTESVPRRKAEPTVFHALAPAWLSKLTGKGAGGTLQVRANVQGAAVSLDGTHVGVTGPQAVAIADVAPGRHEVAVEKSGYTTAKQEFSLAAGQSLPLSLSLSSMSVDVGAAPPAETPPVIVRRPQTSEEPPREATTSGRGTTRAAFWVAVVGTVGATAGGLLFAKQVQQINQDLDKYRRIPVGTPPCSASPTGLCDTAGDPKPARTTAENSIVSSQMDQGHHDQVWEEVLLITAVPLAIAGGYFLYKGYLDSGGGTQTASTARGLRIFPAASASAGGIVTEFDF
ncbi:MAG TPA: PEGA domain-containing protein [Polyangia bacterium]|nr:PEGA domain-containing protein [Polyangia bacterium]